MSNSQISLLANLCSLGITKKYVANTTQFVTMMTQKIMKGRLSIRGTGIKTVGILGIRWGYT